MSTLYCVELIGQINVQLHKPTLFISNRTYAYGAIEGATEL